MKLQGVDLQFYQKTLAQVLSCEFWDTLQKLFPLEKSVNFLCGLIV